MLANQYEIHDFDQYATNYKAFDVTPCYKGNKAIDFEAFLRGNVVFTYTTSLDHNLLVKRLETKNRPVSERNDRHFKQHS